MSRSRLVGLLALLLVLGQGLAAIDVALAQDAGAPPPGGNPGGPPPGGSGGAPPPGGSGGAPPPGGNGGAPPPGGNGGAPPPGGNGGAPPPGGSGGAPPPGGNGGAPPPGGNGGAPPPGGQQPPPCTAPNCPPPNGGTGGAPPPCTAPNCPPPNGGTSGGQQPTCQAPAQCPPPGGDSGGQPPPTCQPTQDHPCAPPPNGGAPGGPGPNSSAPPNAPACQPGQPCPGPGAPPPGGNGTAPPACEAGKPCGPPGGGNAPPPCGANGACQAPPPGGNASGAPPPNCDPSKPCAPPPGGNCAPPPSGEGSGASAAPCGPPPQNCTPDHPCGCPPDHPCGPPTENPNCEQHADGSASCAPPPECSGPSAHCAPPPNCEKTSDGKFLCKPQQPPPNGGGNATGAPPCAPPPSSDGTAAPAPCGAPNGDHNGNHEGTHQPDFCQKQSDGTQLCSPPPQCASGGTDAGCTPPPFCAAQSDGKYLCKPPQNAGNAQTAAGAPCQPPPPTATSADSSNAPKPACGPGGPMPPMNPACQPDATGALKCAPPPDCGGAAFAGAGASGCAPPSFCKAGSDGNFDCKPPEDCREGSGGWQRCFGAPVGAACQKALVDVAAAGSFVPCAPAPSQFCPPLPPGAPASANTCRAPPAAPHFCAPGEVQFKPDHPTGTPPDCMIAPGVRNGQYVSPLEAQGGACVPPPPGEWPPAQPAPAGKVYCPPQGYAPPPQGTGFDAWRNFTGDHAPPRFAGVLQQLGDSWNVNGTQLDDINRAGNVHQLFAPPAFDGRFVNGSFVQSGLDDKMGLQNFTVGGTRFFRDAHPNGGGNSNFSTTAGPAVLSAGGDVVVETHNVPSGLLAYKSAGENAFNVSFTPDAGYNVTLHDGYLIMEKGDWKGVLVGNATRAANGTIQANVNSADPAFFMAIPPTGLEAETRLDIAKGVADNKVFAEVSLVARNDTVAQDITVYDDPTKFHVDVTNTSEDAITMNVSGEGSGQAVVFTVDRSTLTTPLSEFNVTLDNTVMPECANFTALEDSVATGGCYTLNANESVVRVSIMPPHFSAHTITLGAIAPVQSATDTTTSTTPDSTTKETGSTTGSTTTAPTGTTTATPTAKVTATPSPAAGKTPAPGIVLVVGAAIAIALLSRRSRK